MVVNNVIKFSGRDTVADMLTELLGEVDTECCLVTRATS